jgi:putative ABC transport system permease protein
MRGLLASVRYTVRLLLKSPGFTITAILILGSGIGANTAIFSLIDAVLLKPLPFPHPERLAAIYQPYQDFEWTNLDYPDYQDFSAAQHSFESLAALKDSSFDLSGHGDAERLYGYFSTASFFRVLQVPFILGRPFTESEDVPGGPLVVVLNERVWRTRFNADPKILGTQVTLDGQVFEVIGVVSVEVEDWTSGLDLLMPLNLMPLFGRHGLSMRDNHKFACYGRLKEKVTVTEAQAEAEVIQRHLSEKYPEADGGYGIRVVRLLADSVSGYSPTLWLLGGAVGCLWLIATVNISNLLFFRSLGRRKEMAIRSALGADRRRLFGQLLLENVTLSAFGGGLGVLIAFWAIEIVKQLSPQQDLARFAKPSFDLRALAFFVVVMLLASLLFGVLPAYSLSKSGPGSALSDDGSRAGMTGPARQRVQSALIAVQVALACLLLIGAGLLARSFVAVETTPLGFNPHQVLAVQIELPSVRYESGARSLDFFETLLQKTRQLPGVISASLNPNPPFNDWSEVEPFGISGEPDPKPGQEPTFEWQAASPDYFRTLEIPLLSGRDFEASDQRSKQGVVIIDQAIADRFFSGRNAVGQQIHDYSERFGSERRYFTIIGIAKHVLHDRPDTRAPEFQVYFPFPASLRDGILLVRTESDPLVLVPTIRKTVTSTDPTVALSKVSTFDDWIGKKLMTRRLGVLLVGLFSGTALFLSAVGLYGVLAYSVSQRRREIGVRIAVGAQATNILGLVMWQGFRIVGLGLTIGLVAALALTGFINSILYGVSGNDPVMLASAALVLVVAGFLACLLPALRAARIDPIAALRE